MGLTLDLTSAKNYAFRLIKFRARSEKEVRDKLLKKEYPPEIIADTIACLKKTKQVDDRLSRSCGLIAVSRGHWA